MRLPRRLPEAIESIMVRPFTRAHELCRQPLATAAPISTQTQRPVPAMYRTEPQ